MKRKTTEEFIAAARNIFNEYDYSKTEYTGASLHESQRGHLGQLMKSPLQESVVIPR